MTELRPEERWVAACIQAALPGVTVQQHDDGSDPGIYDLDLLRQGEAFAACEVTAAADPGSIELWNLITGGDDRWIERDLIGGWLVTVTPRCRANALVKELPDLLRALENASTAAESHQARLRLAQLQVADVHRGETDYRGSIYVTLERSSELTGGAVDDRSGDGLVSWFNDWISSPEQRHNVEKLRMARHAERHLFVLLPGFTSAPFSASDLLMRSNAPLPVAPPHLAEGLTDLWLMSTWTSGDIFQWHDRWRRFPKVLD